MLQGLLVILLIFVVFMAIVVMFIIRFLHRGITRLRDTVRSAMGMDDDGTADRHSRDYTGRRTRQYSYDGRTAGHRTAGHTSSSGRSSSSGRAAGSQSGRRTQTASGTTIIDSRDPEQVRRKIFADDEGEYVDFEEA